MCNDLCELYLQKLEDKNCQKKWPQIGFFSFPEKNTY